MPETNQIPAGGVEVTTRFVRHRNALLVEARLTDLFLDYYLHLADNGLTLDQEHDRVFKAMLSGFVLHCASRPRNEFLSWTINLQHPRLNLFAAGDNEDGTVTGRVFTEHVKQSSHNLFYVETVRGRGPVRRSVTDFTGSDILRAAEVFYQNSEQRPARYFDLGDDQFALLASHPDCDEPWLLSLSADELRTLADRETLVPLERRAYRWHCGCDEQRIFTILAPAMREDPEDLFHGEETLHMECPRCGALYRVSREALEAHLAQQSKQ